MTPVLPHPLRATDDRASGASPGDAALAQFDSRDLMRGGREVLIRHAGQVYRLRHTRNDKLILVK